MCVRACVGGDGTGVNSNLIGVGAHYCYSGGCCWLARVSLSLCVSLSLSRFLRCFLFLWGFFSVSCYGPTLSTSKSSFCSKYMTLKYRTVDASR